jgi:nucleoside-diphosphate-sugar epimerase
MRTVPPFLSHDTAAALASARVLLTGASGFVGHHLARQAQAAGIELHLLGRNPVDLPGARFHHADLRDRDACHSVLRAVQPDIVINLASPGVAFGTANYQEMVATLALGAEALLSACAELGSVPHVVHIGSGFEYADSNRPLREADPIVPSATRYGAAKAAASAVVGGFRGMLPITLLRPFNIYGAGDKAPRLGQMLIAAGRAGEPLLVSPGEQVRDFLHVDDFGRLAWILAAARPDPTELPVFNVGSGQPRPLREYVEAIAASLRRHGFAADPVFGAVPYRPGEPMLAVPDLSRLAVSHNWQAQVDFAAGVADFVDWELARWA